MVDYVRLAAVATRLIAGAGRVVTFEVLDNEAVDSSRPWRGAGEPTVAASLTQAAAFVPASGGDLGGQIVSEDLLKRASRVCLVAPPPVASTFNMNDVTSIDEGGVRFGVEWIQELCPGSTPVLYAIGVKR